jgi:hypothetical protein
MKEPQDILDQRIIQLSEIDCLRWRDLIEGGTLVTGEIGAGKTTANVSTVAPALPAASLVGGVDRSVRSDETARWIECARQSGREEDFILPNAEEGK